MRPIDMQATQLGVAVLAALLTASCTSSQNPVRSLPQTAAPAPSPGPSMSADSRGCPSTVSLPAGRRELVDYSDFVMVGQVMYLSSRSLPNEMEGTVRSAEVGPLVSTVTCNVADLTRDGAVAPPALVDGSAAYLPVGTGLHAVKGFSTACRVAALVEGHVVLYLAQHEEDKRSATLPCAISATARLSSP